MLKAARTAGTGKVVAVVQPHRYSRLQNLFEGFCTCFNDADSRPRTPTPRKHVPRSCQIGHATANGTAMTHDRDMLRACDSAPCG